MSKDVHALYSAIIISDKYENVKSVLNKLSENDRAKQREILLTKDDNGFTALRMAVENNRLQIVYYFLNIFLEEMKVEPLLLHVAAHNNYCEIINLLLRFGWNVHETDDKKNTPILIAAAANNFEAFLVLLQYDKGTLMVQSVFGYSVLHAAVRANSIRIVQHLHEKHPEAMIELCSLRTSRNDTVLHTAANMCNIEIFKIIVIYFQDVNIQSRCGVTPLHVAIEKNFNKCVEMLIKKGATINLTIDEREDLWWSICCTKNLVILKLFCKDLKLRCPKHTEFFDILQYCFIVAVVSPFHEGVEYFLNRMDWQMIVRYRPNSEIRKISSLQSSNPETTEVSPMQFLIKYMPKMAQKIFDKCYSDRSFPSFNEEDEIGFNNYEFLDDMYYIPINDDNIGNFTFASKKDSYRQGEVENILGKSRVPIYSSITSFFEHDSNTEEYSYLMRDVLCVSKNMRHKLKPEARRRHSNYYKTVGEHPLKLMFKFNRYDLLSHKLVESYITLKWNRCIKGFYYLLLLYHFILVSVMTYIILNIPQKMIFQIAKSNDTFNEDSYIDTEKCLIQQFPRSIIAGMGVLHSLFIIYKLWHRFEPIRRLLDILIVTLIFSLLFCKYFYYFVEWHIIIVLNLFLWAIFINDFKSVPRFGIYILIVLHTLKLSFRFAPVFFMFLTPFAVTFYVQIKEERNILTFFKTIAKSMAMMTGELNFDDNVNDNSTVLNNLIFFFFMLMFTIFLMNILIGLAVSDTTATLQEASRLRMKLQIETIFHIESLMPESWRRHFWIGNEMKSKDDPKERKFSIKYFQSLFRWFGLSKAAMNKLYQNSNNSAEESTNDETEALWQKLERTCETIEMTQMNLKETEEQLEATARTFVQLQNKSIPFIDEPH